MTDTHPADRWTALALGSAGLAINAGCPGGATPLAWKLDSGQPRGAALAPDGALYVVDNEGTLLRARLAQGW